MKKPQDSASGVGFSRRMFVGGALLGSLAAPAVARAQATMSNSTEMEKPLSPTIRRNISSFRTHHWQDYFSNTRNGAILVDINSRALHFWSEDQAIYRLYPTSVPETDDLTRKGRTEVVKKVDGPSWRPTPAASASPASIRSPNRNGRGRSWAGCPTPWARGARSPRTRRSS